MKSRILYTLPLAAALAFSAMAQQAATDNQQPTATTSTSSPSSEATTQTSAATTDNGSTTDQNLSARQPLQPETHEGFWGKLNPFARKKYVQKQMTPIRNRVNELDELTANNSKAIKDVDARAQEGIRQASAKANEADQQRARGRVHARVEQSFHGVH